MPILTDIFIFVQMSVSEGQVESQAVFSRKVETFEVEFMVKVSKQQRSKMNRVQVCVRLTGGDDLSGLR